MAVVNGTAGNDIIHVEDDWVIALPGYTDIPDATALGDTLNGLGGVDLLVGGDGGDLLNGGDGSDILVGGTGADTLTGGAGIDTIRYDGAEGVVIDLTTALGVSGDAEGDVISGIEIVEGTAFNDGMVGSAASETLSGRDGNDDLYARGGNDSLRGGAGNDRLRGEDGNDALSGGDGDDTLEGGVGADRIDGGLGTDLLDYYYSAAVTVDLSTGRCAGGHAQGDVISGVENIQGTTSYGDILTGSAASNVLSGGGGNDTLSGLGGGDTLYGGSGDDILRGGAGADAIDGGDGVDLLSFFGATAALWVSLIGAPGQGYTGDAAGDTYKGIENVSGGRAGDFLLGSGVDNVLNGYEGSDELQGHDGDDTLLGGAGDDLLQGDAGADRLDGGAGIDTIAFDINAGVTVDLGTGLCSGGHAQGDVISGIENIQGTLSNGDTLTGSSGTNRLEGRGGNDVLGGLGGADTLIGGDGDDTLRGGDGDDFLYVGAGADTMDGGAGRDTMVFDRAMVADWQAGVLDADISGDPWSNWEAIQGSAGDDRIRTNSFGFAVELRGGAGNDVLAAGTTFVGIVDDTLSGEAGNDSLDGGVGDDMLRGGAGADVLAGAAGTDTASYYGGTTGILVSLASGTGGGGEAQGDTLSGIENLSGSQGNDSLYGDADANVLQGWNGNDALIGRAGKDTLAGGAGADRFTFTVLGDSVVGANADRITDFSHAQGDRIDLMGIDARTTAGGDQAFTFIGIAAFTGVAGQLRFVASGGVTIIAGDVNGDKVSDFHITLTGQMALVAADFVL